MKKKVTQEITPSQYFREGIESYIRNKMCTGFAVIIETLNEDGEYEIHTIYDEKTPNWRNASLLGFATDKINYEDFYRHEEDY